MVGDCVVTDASLVTGDDFINSLVFLVGNQVAGGCVVMDASLVIADDFINRLVVLVEVVPGKISTLCGRLHNEWTGRQGWWVTLPPRA